MHRFVALFGLACLVPIVAGCGDDVKTQPTATASTLGSSAPKTVGAKKFVIDTNESKVSFVMEAPSEKIRGRAAGATSGDLFIDPTDLMQTTGTIAVDLDKLELFQRKKDHDEDTEFQSEVKNTAQNGHARDWLEISESSDRKPEDRTNNARTEFKITSILSASNKDITKMTGNERTVTIKAEGVYKLHQHDQKKMQVELDVTFKFDGDKITECVIKTKAPMKVNLAEFEVKPRDLAGKILQKGLDALSKKVAQEAPVEVEIHAKPEGMPLSTTPPPADSTPVVSPPGASGSASATPATSAAPATSAKPK